MTKTIIVEGRVLCDECNTDKSWAFSIDRSTKSQRFITGRLNEDELIAKSIKRQNKEIINPEHEGHTEILRKTVRVVK